VYAIFEDGGKQYKVSEGDALLVERRELGEGQSELTFDNVLMVGEGEAARVGTPRLDGASVTARILEEVKLRKVVGLKFNRRKGYRRKWGHRQRMLRVQITGIHA
jgi:large subunit ribosomal protein L21